MAVTMDPITLTKALIACKSITPDEGGALNYLKEKLEKLGFYCQWLSFKEEGTATVDNLYARLGTSGPHLCFAGHTDVVPPGDESEWSVPPFEPAIVDDYLIGRGAVDMKGAISCFLAATAQYLENQKEISGSISFLITGDEEGPAINGTRKMLEWLQKKGETIDACIVGEPTNPESIGQMIKIGRRGSVSFALDIEGVQGHVAYPHLAENPVRYMVQILHQLQNRRLDDGNNHFDPSHLEVTTIDVDNDASNVIPAHAKAHFNIRFNDMHRSESLIAWVKDTCEAVMQEARQASYTLSTHVSGESFLTKPGPLSELVVAAVEEVTGKTPELSTTGGTSDARFIKDICPVVECGLINQTAHKVDEKIATHDLQVLTKIYFSILNRFLS